MNFYRNAFRGETWMRQLVLETAGCMMVAAGVANFAVPAAFPMSGFTGLSLILYRLFDVPIGLCTVILNIPVGIACWRVLGKSFFVSSVRCMFLSSTMIDYVAPLFPAYHGSRLLAALCAGVFLGIGYAVIYMQGTSTGGMDFIIMAFKKKHPHLPVGRILFFADTSVIVAGGILLRDMDGILCGMIMSFLLSAVVDKLMYGVNAGKLTFIVTDNGRRICEVIDEVCGRGTTILEGIGGYCGDQRQIVMCACSNKEMYLVQKAVKTTDPRAFLIILESNEVHGEGFRNVQLLS